MNQSRPKRITEEVSDAFQQKHIYHIPSIHHVPSGKRLQKTMERSTMLCSWVNQRTFYGHFQ